MAEGNYIRLYRKMMEWGWYKDVPTKTLFLHCLLKANWRPSEFMGVKIEPGSFTTSLSHLATETGLTVQNVRTAVKHLKMTNEITWHQHGKFSVISIVQWDSYQGNQQGDNNQLTGDQHSANNNRRNKEYKNIINSPSRTDEGLMAWVLEGEEEDRWKEAEANGEFNESAVPEVGTEPTDGIHV